MFNVLVVSYVFSIVVSGGVSLIKFVGFDGYFFDDKCYYEMNEIIMLFRNVFGLILIELIINISYELF